MTTDFIQAGTRIVTMQIKDSGVHELTPPGFMLVDLLISSTSKGQITVAVSDDVNKHIIMSMKEGNFNHNFSHGWTFWKEGKLKLVKENNTGIVNIAVGYVKIHNNFSYDQWRRA